MPNNHHGILVDRCLSPAIANALSRFHRFKAVHLSEVYEQSEATEDIEFLADAGDQRWGVYTQNDQMLRMPREMNTIGAHSTRVFTLTSSQLTDAARGLLFGRHLISIRRRLDKPDACFWRLYEERKNYDLG